MTRSAILISGAAALIVLAWLCAGHHRAAVEADLEAAGKEALSRAGLSWAAAAANGCVLSLSGSPPGDRAAQKATAILEEIPGVCSVVTDRGLAESAAPGLRFAAGRSESRIHLEGSVPDRATRESLVARAAAIVGAQNVEDELQVERATPPPGWAAAATALIDSLGALVDGQGSLTGSDVDVQGIASDAESARAARAILAENLPREYDGRASVSSLDETSTVLPVVCQRLLRELMREEIRFAPNSTEIDRSSFSLLDRVARTADRCPKARIVISGHTDSQGDAEANRELSEARAETVRTYLIQTGISPARLDAVGHGDTRPIADNNTAEGRLRNRRIEFEVQ